MDDDLDPLAEIAKLVRDLDADQLHFMFALACAMNERDTKPELYALMVPPDPDALTAWLRSHGWLADGTELGPRALLNMAQIGAPGEHLN